ncbi:isochorismate synthase [Pseudonocardia sp. MH-G8]|uniref:isochorismate synthase n=1 Tax=Pseudonocardia sp. MH-G8 TaxID=1854588 RepID=UPI000B9FD177|nr:isochorismate synthase [Pseudonocardia sp. MH-G8]OZM81031.1 isochorismate synthase [Pseudonocardia sp. MH-G8]
MSIPALDRPRPEHRAADLLAAYLPGSFFYSSTSGSLLADGVHALVDTGRGSRADAAATALADAAASGVDEPVVVGALGFAAAAQACLVVPALVRRAGARSAAPAPPPLPGRWSVRRRPEPQDYVDGVRRALALIGDGSLEKVVLARSLELTADRVVAVPALLSRLVAADPAAHAFAVDVTAPGDAAPRTLVGASPELLVSRTGDVVRANPLAGSRPRAGDAAEDARRIAGLRTSDKDRREHAMVTAQVAEVLGRFCTDLQVPAYPDVLGTATMWHLSSPISGRLDDPSVSSLALAEALHPTPAVCGTPAAAARGAIGEIEGVDRGYYSGLVGWCDAGGDGEWAVTLRSAEVSGDTVRLFAGAGVVAGSDPDAELAETGAKFRTLLRAIGLEDV